jgi:ABC-type uncharacterized transport system ATPase subunit
LSQKFRDKRRVRLTFGEPVESIDLAKYGRVVSSEDCEAVLEVPSDTVAAVASSVLAAFPVADLAIEEVDIEDVVRELFTGQK